MPFKSISFGQDWIKKIMEEETNHVYIIKWSYILYKINLFYFNKYK